MTTDWSSDVSVISEDWSLGLMAGRGFSSLGVLGVAENTSPASAGAGAGIRAASLGNGGTGGGKASNRGELEYVAIDVVDGDDVRVRCKSGGSCR